MVSLWELPSLLVVCSRMLVCVGHSWVVVRISLWCIHFGVSLFGLLSRVVVYLLSLSYKIFSAKLATYNRPANLALTLKKVIFWRLTSKSSMDARHATHTLIVEGGEWDSFCFECAIDVIFHHEYEINRLRSAVLHVTKCLEEITDNLRSIRRDVYSAILEKLLLRMQINGPQVSRNRTGVANGIPNFLFSFCLDIKLLHHLSITEVI